MIRTSERDDPWRRLPALLPAALLLTLALLMGFLRLLAEPQIPRQKPVLPPLEVGLVVVPVPAGPAVPPLAAPEPTPPRPPDLVAEPEPPVDASPVPVTEDALPPPVEPLSDPPTAPVEEPKAEAAPRPRPKPAPPPRTAASRPAETQPPAASSAPNPPQAALPSPTAPIAPAVPGGGTMGARAIFKPLPELPEALRKRRIELVAVARFTVAADGGAKVELIEPTPDPELNQALLDTLRGWRFFPAMENGHAVAATLDIRIPLSVR